MMQIPEKTLERIAQEKLGLETLETRMGDSLDFHDLAVWCVRAALEEAYKAGYAKGLADAGK